jgi:hypothetical protein
MAKFLEWYGGVAECRGLDKVAVKWESMANRVVVAKKFIKKDEVVLAVPKHSLVTLEYAAQACQINRLIITTKGFKEELLQKYQCGEQFWIHLLFTNWMTH